MRSVEFTCGSPYGSTISATGSLPTDRLFTGQRREAGLELYDYRARFYDPLVGSFISADTVAPEGGNPRAWNRYGYVYGNPVRWRVEGAEALTPAGGRLCLQTAIGEITWLLWPVVDVGCCKIGKFGAFRRSAVIIGQNLCRNYSP